MHIHFIGIGGISMSGLAQICINLGYQVTGSDSSENSSIKKLNELGAKIHLGHNSDNIDQSIDLVVYTAAVKKDNEELQRALELGINIVDRATFLGEIMSKYENSIAISGTHGKTTTTSMSSVIFKVSNNDPTILVGGNLKDIDGNVRIGDSEYFITEACEYVDSFLKFYPKIAVILNIEEDHLDYFKDIAQIEASFRSFANQVKSDGYVIANGDDQNVRSALHNLDKDIIYFGQSNENNGIIEDIIYDGFGLPSFTLSLNGKILGRFSLKVPGEHNIYNACASILASYVSGIDLSHIKEGIELYSGVGRRFELKGEINGIKIYDDYAHHPTELKATLKAASRLQKSLLYTVFQPHTYSRTKELMDKFAESFFESDVVIISDIYASREKDNLGVHSKDLVEEIKKHGKDAIYIGDLNEVSSYLATVLKENDIIFTVGAGDVYTVGDYLLELLSSNIENAAV